jgi:hypothetical protein
MIFPIRRLPARAGLSACLLAAVALLTLPLSVGAQEGGHSFYRGTEAFRFILQKRDFKPSTLQQLHDNPAGSILIVFGQTHILNQFESHGGLRRFVELGGAALVATDHDTPDSDGSGLPLLRDFGVEIAGQPVLVPEGSADCYRGFRDCPFVNPSRVDVPPLFVDLNPRVATNRAGYLKVSKPEGGEKLPILAVFPRGAAPAPSTNSFSRFIPPFGRRAPLPFAAGGRRGKGRILVLADHSVFINNMLFPLDTGNEEFTQRCLDWLSDGPEHPDHVLFSDQNGLIIEDFRVATFDLPPTSLEDTDLVAVADRMVAALEDDNAFNWFLLEHVSIWQILKVLSIALTVALLAYGVYRLMRARYRTDPAAPLLAATLVQLAPVPAGLAPRHRELLAEGNLWEPARALAREFFEAALRGKLPDTDAPPPFDLDEGWLARRAVQKEVQRLWRLARAATPERVTPAEFAHLAGQVDRLKAGLEDGTLHFGDVS